MALYTRLLDTMEDQGEKSKRASARPKKGPTEQVLSKLRPKAKDFNRKKVHE